MDYPIRIVAGNWFKLTQPLSKIEWEDSTRRIVDYAPQEGDTFKVTLIGSYSPYEMEHAHIKEGTTNELEYENNGTLPLGLYDIEIRVVLADGRRLRSHQSEIVKIVKTNREASIPNTTEFGIDTFELDGAVFMYVPNGGGEDGVGIDSITTVENAEDGGNNVVTIHLTDGTESSFNVKNGHKGSDGAQGPQGPAGQNGTNGTNGTNGSDGKSAYEIAVENGFVGDETAWLASLKGEQGIQGTQGPTGPQGPAGTTDYNNLNNKPTIDQTPTSGNTTHLVSSDGVYQYVDSICGAILTRLQNI